jgi:hypothetical protein
MDKGHGHIAVTDGKEMYSYSSLTKTLQKLFQSNKVFPNAFQG